MSEPAAHPRTAVSAGAVQLEPLPAQPPGSRPPTSLLLLVHGRTGGAIPAELRAVAAELEHDRGAPVRLLALTDPAGMPPPAVVAAATLVPLLLLPGAHVRLDLPALVARLRQQGLLRRLPFLGSWPLWQKALAHELADLAAQRPAAEGLLPTLLHHPLEGPLAERYLADLGRRCGARCRPAVLAAGAEPGRSVAVAAQDAVLPYTLAANRITDSLQAAGLTSARPLLERARLRRVLLEALGRLP